MQQKLLSGIELFSSLSEEELRLVSDRCNWRNCSAGEQVVSHRDSSCAVYFVIAGRLRAKVFSVEGKEVSYRDISTGEMFGEFAAIDGKPRSADVSALDDSCIATMSPEVFWRILRDHSAVTASLLRHLTGIIRVYSDRIFEFSTLAVKNRIHAELLRLARLGVNSDNTAMISPAPTHEEIATRISTHREAVTREMNQLGRTGLIAREGRVLYILDLGGLKQMVEDVTG